MAGGLLARKLGEQTTKNSDCTIEELGIGGTHVDHEAPTDLAEL